MQRHYWWRKHNFYYFSEIWAKLVPSSCRKTKIWIEIQYKKDVGDFLCTETFEPDSHHLLFRCDHLKIHEFRHLGCITFALIEYLSATL